jgi:hypothetical protein
MRDMRTSEIEVFPAYGARARVWGRFERDLREWMETPEGRFARWHAGIVVAGAEPEGDED